MAVRKPLQLLLLLANYGADATKLHLSGSRLNKTAQPGVLG